jgi:hypothetical protein
MEIDELARRVGGAADAIGDAAARLGRSDPGPGAFGTDAPGALGELSRDLHAACTGALGAREREAAAHGARLTELAGALRQSAQA